MKLKTSVWNAGILVICLLLTSNCLSFKKVNGDGNLVTREIATGDYDAICCHGGSIKISYTQSDNAPGLTVTVDRNIFEMYDFKVDDRKLKIEPKEKNECYRFIPTRFEVVTNSTGLRKVSAAGRVEFTVDGPLRTEALKLDLAGSTKVDLKDSVILRKLSVDIAGSGTLKAFALDGKTFDADIAGSGKIDLGGRVTTASFEIAGSGRVHAFDLQTEDVKCEIAGSGNLEITANSSIRAEVAGSGHIKYYGNPPQVMTQIAGSGSVRKAD
jgi:hypothetical protein